MSICKISLMAVMTAIMSISAWAEESVTIAFSSFGWANYTEVPQFSQSGITFTPRKGDRTVGPKYYSQYSSLVLNGTNSLDINFGDKAVSKIEITVFKALPADQCHVHSSVGAMEVSNAGLKVVWTNNRPVQDVSLSMLANTIVDGVTLRSMTFTLVDPVEVPQDDLPAVPVFSPRGGMVYDYNNISISSASSDARIYYTLDGSNPEVGVSGTLEYTGPFALQQSALVKAISVTDAGCSSIGAFGFAVPVSCANIAELLTNPVDRQYYTLAGLMTVTMRLGSTCWLKDDTGSFKLFGDAVTNRKPETGWQTRNVTGRYNLDNNTPEFELVDNQTFTPWKTSEPCRPRVVTAAELPSCAINEYLEIRGARLENLGNYDYNLTDESGTVQIRNNYHIAISDDLMGHEVNVTLFPAYYGYQTRYYVGAVVDPNAYTEPEEPGEKYTGPGDGSSTSPFTVENALANGGDNFQSYQCVRGYVVGTIGQPILGNFGDFHFGTENANENTILLADYPGIKDASRCLKLIYISGNLKNDLNLANHPEMLGAYVKVYGAMGANYGAMTNASTYELIKSPASLGSVGIDVLTQDDEAWFDLQGVEVSACRLIPGKIYMHRLGNRVTKELIR